VPAVATLPQAKAVGSATTAAQGISVCSVEGLTMSRLLAPALFAPLALQAELVPTVVAFRQAPVSREF
jgi:hypothetical protein